MRLQIYTEVLLTAKEIFMKKNENIQLSSTSSMRISLKAIYDGEAGLNERRKQILSRVPNSDNWATFEYNSISVKDIAYLSAATHHEFALLRGKSKDILFHGVGCHCNIIGEMLELLKQRKLRLIAHTHPDYDEIIPSKDDRLFLKQIGQQESIIISYITGKELTFSASLFQK